LRRCSFCWTDSSHALDFVGKRTASVVLALLLLAAAGDVFVNLRYAKAIDPAVAVRAHVIAQAKNTGATSLVLKPLPIGAVGLTTPIRAIVWGDIGSSPDEWTNQAVASYPRGPWTWGV
jgi:hypothetical protein